MHFDCLDIGVYFSKLALLALSPYVSITLHKSVRHDGCFHLMMHGTNDTANAMSGQHLMFVWVVILGIFSQAPVYPIRYV